MTEKQHVEAICKELREPVDFAGTDPLHIKVADLIEMTDAGHARLMDALKLFLGHLRAESRLIPNAYEIHIKYDDYKKMSDAYFGEKIRTSTVLKKLGESS